MYVTNNLKDKILNNISEISIFSRYLGISESDIHYCLAKSQNRISNPLRSDNNPSLTFKQYSSKIIMIDYANQYYRGDVFEIVGKILGLNCNVSNDFIKICNDIINNCNIKISNKSKNVSPIKKSNTVIDIVPRNLNNLDLDYFRSQGLRQNTVYKYIIPVATYSINNTENDYVYTSRDPCYAYKVNPNKYKLYFPNRNKKQVKFITNNKLIIECVLELKTMDNLIVTKSMKDKLLLKQMIEDLKLTTVQVISISSESVRLRNHENNILKSYSKNIYMLLDIDSTGIESSNYHRDTYGYIPIFFSIKFNDTKDPSESVHKYGYVEVLEHFKNISIEQKWK